MLGDWQQNMGRPGSGQPKPYGLRLLKLGIQSIWGSCFLVPTAIFQKERTGQEEPQHRMTLVHLGVNQDLLMSRKFRDGERGKLEVAWEKERKIKEGRERSCFMLQAVFCYSTPPSLWV